MVCGRKFAGPRRALMTLYLLRAVSVLLIGLPIAGCKKSETTPPEKPVPESAADKSWRISRTRPADVRFKLATLLKPADDTPDAAARMAPLILREMPTDTSDPAEHLFGLLTVDDQDRVLVDRSRPAVYVFADGNADGGQHRRIAHLWFRGVDIAKKEGGSSDFRCVRMTLDATGAPVVWEIFDSRKKTNRAVYLARSLEEAADEQHGEAIRGHKFVAERESGVRIARLIDDGPEPMGPMVYVSAKHGEIVSLACRCMPSQVDDIDDAIYYELVLTAQTEEQMGSHQQQIQLFFEMHGLQFTERAEAFFSRELKEHLRLPDGF